MTAAESFANDAAAAVTVAGGIGGVVAPGTVETWTVADASTLPAAVTGTSQWHGNDPAAPAEKFLVTNMSGTTLTVTRAAEGPAVDHTAGGTLAGFVIRPVLTAAVLATFAQAGGGGGMSNPMSGVGDLITGGASGTPARVAADTSNTRKFLREQSSGGTPAGPVWDTLQAGDIPSLAGTYDAAGAASAAQAAAIAVSAQRASNLSDLASASTARANLGLGTAAVAALTSLLQAASNLSDLGSAATARTNLGLGSLATKSTPLGFADGGNGQTTQQAALDAIAGAVTAAMVLAGNGTHVTLRALAAADLPAATTGAQGAVQLDSTAADIQPVGAQAAVGTSTKVPKADHIHQGITVLAATSAAGTALINGTQNLCSWTAPSDGQMHRVFVTCVIHVTSSETGGALQVTWSGPDGTAGTPGSLFAGGAGSGTVKAATEQYLVGPGTTVTVQQSSALTGGACTAWAEIDGY